MASKPSKSYVFTINNYTEECVAAVKAVPCVRIICGKEVGECGTPHLQGAIVFAKAMRMKAASQILGGRASMKVMKGRWADQTYCAKDGDLLRMEDNSQQGARTDLARCKRLIDEGADELTLCEQEFGTMSRHSAFLMRYRDLKRRKTVFRKEMTQMKWYWGKTGVGKSHKVYENYDPATTYVLEVADNGWWDGYDGEPIVIINEFRGQIEYAQLLDLTDKWPKKVKRRNQEPTPFMAKEIRITSCMPPEDVYHRQVEKKDSIDQLLRRCEVIHLTK